MIESKSQSPEMPEPPHGILDLFGTGIKKEKT